MDRVRELLLPVLFVVLLIGSMVYAIADTGEQLVDMKPAVVTDGR